MKKILKKLFKAGVIALCVATFSLSLAACSDDDPAYFTVTFESNGGSAVASQQVESGKTAKRPADPMRDSYSFLAWYSDTALKTEYDFTAAITANITLYAGWNASSCTVTFDLNYEGSVPVTSAAEVGKALERPADPVRDEYTFMGWFEDKEGTAPYDFAKAVTGDMTLYAYWFEVPSGYGVATFYMNDGTENFWQRVVFTTGAFYQDIADKVSDPEREDNHFTGWYSDEDCTRSYSALNSFKENVSVYAGWQRVYTLEAEHTYLTGKVGSGYSGATTGTGMVIGDNTDNQTASNGYYVGWMYYNGAFLSFEFEAEEAADDVTIVFRLSAQYNDVAVTGDQIYVGVNFDEGTGTYEQKIEFPLTIESYGELSSNVKDFKDYVVAADVSIQKGKNTIELMINNDIKGVGGTMKAAAPLVDCMYLYTNASLAQTKYNAQFGG